MTARVAKTPSSRILLVALALVALALPAGASASSRATAAPPGDSGITQYLEVVPTPTGASPPGTGGGHGGVLTDAQRRRLDARGPDGRALAVVLDATTPPSAAPGAAASGGAAGTRRAGAPLARTAANVARSLPLAEDGRRRLTAAPSRADGSPASLILDAVGGHGSGELGLFLPAFMLTSMLAVVGALAVRRRRTH